MTSASEPLSDIINEPKDFHKKNLELIKQLQEKKIKEQEKREEKRQKENEIRESLKNQILSKISHEHQDEPESARKQRSFRIKRGSFLKTEKDPILRNQEPQNSAKKSAKSHSARKSPPPDIIERQKLRKYFRSRYNSFLCSLKQQQEEKKNEFEAEKKKKKRILQKIREEMGIVKVQSKVLESTEAMKGKRNEKRRDEKEEGGKIDVKIAKMHQEKLLEKQKEYLVRIFEKCSLKKLEEEKKANRFASIKPRPRPSSSQKNKKKNKKANDFTRSSTSLTKNIKEDRNKSEHDEERTRSEAKVVEKIKNDNIPTPVVKRKKLKRFYPFITDLEEWKKKQRINPETRVFIILGGYTDLKKSLLDRGWIENPDPDSLCFDVKWTLFAKDIQYDRLRDFQIVNHFEKNTSITTKVGLSKNLRNLIWFNNVDIDTFYPSCFDLSDINDFEDFLIEFKCIKAEAILKLFYQKYEERSPDLKDFQLKAKVALSVCERRVQDLDEIIDKTKNDPLISANEWDILSSDELTLPELAQKKHETWLKKVDSKFNKPKAPKSSKTKKKRKAKNTIREENEEESNEKANGSGELDLFTERVKGCLETLQEKFPQFSLNGSKNIWIVKPAGLSRGRGIATYNNLVEIMDYVESKESQWVVQKYMENPLLIKNKKFDIRQWVLVTDWNPITVWFYEKCYCRFSPENYDIDNLNNKFIHLTNNSIVKYSNKFDTSEIEGNMWTCDEFDNHLKELTGESVFLNKIKPKMKEIVKWSLESAQDMIENRKNSHELFGYDFMIDEDYNPWLIEINSSPAMDYSTAVTESMVKMVLSDIAKVIVDYNFATKKKKVDTGLFTCIYKGNTIAEKPINSCGLNLVLEGKSIKK